MTASMVNFSLLIVWEVKLDFTRSFFFVFVLTNEPLYMVDHHLYLKKSPRCARGF